MNSQPVPSWMDGSLTGAVNQDEVESFFTFSVAALLSLSPSLFGLLEKHSRLTVYTILPSFILFDIIRRLKAGICRFLRIDIVSVGGNEKR